MLRLCDVITRPRNVRAGFGLQPRVWGRPRSKAPVQKLRSRPQRASATWRADAVASAQSSSATDASLTTPGRAQVIDLAGIAVVAKRLELVAEHGALSFWTTRASWRSLRARRDVFAERSEQTELDVHELIAFEVLTGAIGVHFAFPLADPECAIVLALACQAAATADCGIAAALAIRHRTIQKTRYERVAYTAALESRLGAGRLAATTGHRDRHGQKRLDQEHRTKHVANVPKIHADVPN